MYACPAAGALLVACLHDSIPEDLLLHPDSSQPATPRSPNTIPEDRQDGDSSGQAQSGGKVPQSSGGLLQGVSKLSPGHNLSRLSPGQRLSRIIPRRYAPGICSYTLIMHHCSQDKLFCIILWSQAKCVMVDFLLKGACDVMICGFGLVVLQTMLNWRFYIVKLH